MITEITVFETTLQILSWWVGFNPYFLLGWFAWFLLTERYFFIKLLRKSYTEKELLALDNGDLNYLLSSLKEGYLLKLLQAIKQYEPNGKRLCIMLWRLCSMMFI